MKLFLGEQMHALDTDEKLDATIAKYRDLQRKCVGQLYPAILEEQIQLMCERKRTGKWPIVTADPQVVRRSIDLTGDHW